MRAIAEGQRPGDRSLERNLEPAAASIGRRRAGQAIGKQKRREGSWVSVPCRGRLCCLRRLRLRLRHWRGDAAIGIAALVEDAVHLSDPFGLRVRVQVFAMPTQRIEEGRPRLPSAGGREKLARGWIVVRVATVAAAQRPAAETAGDDVRQRRECVGRRLVEAFAGDDDDLIQPSVTVGVLGQEEGVAVSDGAARAAVRAGLMAAQHGGDRNAGKTPAPVPHDGEPAAQGQRPRCDRWRAWYSLGRLQWQHEHDTISRLYNHNILLDEASSFS